MIAIVDCGIGNFQSIENAFKYLGGRVKITDQPREIKKSKKIILIGVGNFGQASKNLNRKKLDLLIKKEILRGKPFLGICLGMQLLFEGSQEDLKTEGLGIFKGRCWKFKKVKTPQIGWNQVKIQKRVKIFKNIKQGSYFYFMHSFYPKPTKKETVVAKSNYSKDFCSAVNFKNIFGVQFHPEKSGKTGLQILKNFIEL